MAPPTRHTGASILTDKIGILDKDVAESSPVQPIIVAASAILAVVQAKKSRSKYSIQIADFCFVTCQTLKTIIHGMDERDLRKSTGALQDIDGLMHKIEQIIKRGRGVLNKGKIEGIRLEICQKLDLLAASKLLDTESNADDCVSSSTSIYPHTITSIPRSLCERLINGAFNPNNLASLIEAIFSSEEQVSTVRRLRGGDAQAFADVMDETLGTLDLPQRIRMRCLRALYKTCDSNAIVPNSFRIPLCYDRLDFPLHCGGFADVWKGKHNGQEVAVKTIRTASRKDLPAIAGKLCKEVVTWKALRHPNVLPLLGVIMNEHHFAMVSEWMENGNISEFVKQNPGVDRLGLLVDVTHGVIYMHSQGMVHGDLKGANILIDNTLRARVADFSLLAIVPDASNIFSSTPQGHAGTPRWMSPEILDPEGFGSGKSLRTPASDCYALGMVIYETISGHLPFHNHSDLTVFKKILEGKCPPRGHGFTNTLWETLEMCWERQPYARPSAEEILRRLERVLSSTETSAPDEETDGDDDYDDDSDSTENSSGTGAPQPPKSPFTTIVRHQRCSSCRQVGHNSRSQFCPKHPNYNSSEVMFPVELVQCDLSPSLSGVGLQHKPVTHTPRPLRFLPIWVPEGGRDMGHPSTPNTTTATNAKTE